jgi:hypothetical protein
VDDTPCLLYFSDPACRAHRQYEALRAVFVEGLAQNAAAARFGFSPGAFRQLVLSFRRTRAAGTPPPFSPRLRLARPGHPPDRRASQTSPTPPTPGPCA